MKIRFLIESSKSCFPEKVQIDLKPRDILKIASDANNYGMMLMFCVITTFGGIMSQFKNILQNHQAALSMSIVSLGLSIVWNFTIFWQHFVYAGQNSYFDFIRIPACGYFLTSFLFEFRLLQEVFKIQNQQLLNDPAMLKKKFIIVYVGIYILFVLFFVYRDILIYNSWVVVVTCGTIWLSQIHQNYRCNLRNHQPSMGYCVSLTVS